MQKIVILDNFLRYNDGQAFNTPWMKALFDYIFSYSNLKVEQIYGDNAQDLYQKLYKAFEYKNIEKASWIKLYKQEHNEDSLNIIKENFSNSLVIAFELHPLMQFAFDKLNIPYIKLMVHPIRYMDDIFLGITSSEKSIFEKIKNYQVDDNYFYQNAMFLKAKAGVSEFCKKFYIEPDSAVFFAQTNMDCSLLDGSRIVNLLDYKDQFEQICKTYNKVYYKIHPVEKNEDIIQFVKSFKNVQILYPHEINVYDMLSCSNVKKCFSISSGAIYEAKYFGKEIEYFLGQPFKFVNDYKNENEYNYKNTFVPIYKIFWQPAFWADILQDYIPVDKPIPQNTNENFSNKLRGILGLTWGYNDNSSVHTENRLHYLENELNKANKNKIAKLLTFYIPVKKVRTHLREKIERIINEC